jgi:hypothetical protein
VRRRRRHKWGRRRLRLVVRTRLRVVVRVWTGLWFRIVRVCVLVWVQGVCLGECLMTVAPAIDGADADFEMLGELLVGGAEAAELAGLIGEGGS